MIKIGRIGFLYFLLSVTISAVYGATAPVEFKLNPETPWVGEPVELSVTSRVDMPKLQSLPAISGLRWLQRTGTRQSTQVVNGKMARSFSTGIVFQVSKAGKFVIPSFDIVLNGKRYKTTPISFSAYKKSRENEGDLYFTEGEPAVEYFGKELGDILYAGQEIPVLIHVYLHDKKMNVADFDVPNLAVEGVSLGKLKLRDGSEKSIVYLKSGRTVRNGARYMKTTFIAKIIPMSGAEQLNYSLKMPVQVQTSNRRSIFGFSRKQVNLDLEGAIKGLNIRPLPPVPNDAGTFLGLIGSWNADLALDKSTVRVGEQFALTLKLKGTGSTNNLIVPSLEPQGFVVYDPEKRIDEDGKEISLTWGMIPDSENAALPDFTFCTFDMRTKSYKKDSFRKNLNILPPLVPQTGALIDDSSGEGPSEERQKIQTETVFHVKTEAAEYFSLPIWKRSGAVALGMFASILVMISCATWVSSEKRKLSGDRSYRRRNAALKRKSALIKKLNHTSGDEVTEVVRSEVTPFAADVLGYPPGSSPTELADMIRDSHPELSEQLESAVHGGFMPGQSSGVDVSVISRCLNKLGMFLVFLFTAFALQAENASPADSLAEAAHLYEQGKVEKAIQVYESLQKDGKRNPVLLYNIGNCRFLKGEFGRALACYEKARRLAPRDNEIRENLNFVRRRLELPPVLHIKTPLDLITVLQHQMRPDEWLLLAGVVALCAGIYVTFSLLASKRIVKTIVITLSVISLFSLLTIWQLNTSTYKVKALAVAVNKNTSVYRLPNEHSDPSSFVLQQGAEVHVLEHRTEWLRIRLDDAEGWVQKGSVEFVW